MGELTTASFGISRRKILIGGAGMASRLPVAIAAMAEKTNISTSSKQSKGGNP